jgi:NAD(P)-dependent dehydrogenase (short-subunit alcohol dehydrogenase family)
MQDFRGKLAAITGAGSGIGRELALQLAGAGADIAICDLFEDALAATKAACEQVAPGVRVSTHRCDVSDEAQVIMFRDAVLAEHATDHVELLFNNAGVSGGGSFVHDYRASWDRVFAVCWFGVYYCTRAFMPHLIKSREACLINVSSINGTFAIDSNGPHTAYSTAKFAVKGFTESLVTDLLYNAPHVSVVLVMPGHVGTSIAMNTLRSQGLHEPKDMSEPEIAAMRAWMTVRKIPHETLSDDQVRAMLQKRFEGFKDLAPTSAASAAQQILEAVKTKKWRLLVGDDAKFLDKAAREHPDELYEPEFVAKLKARPGRTW